MSEIDRVCERERWGKGEGGSECSALGTLFLFPPVGRFPFKSFGNLVLCCNSNLIYCYNSFSGHIPLSCHLPPSCSLSVSSSLPLLVQFHDDDPQIATECRHFVEYFMHRQIAAVSLSIQSVATLRLQSLNGRKSQINSATIWL